MLLKPKQHQERLSSFFGTTKYNAKKYKKKLVNNLYTIYTICRYYIYYI